MVNKSTKFKVGRYVIGLHGLLYLIAGIWSTVFLASFEKVTDHLAIGLDYKLHIINGVIEGFHHAKWEHGRFIPVHLFYGFSTFNFREII